MVYRIERRVDIDLTKDIDVSLLKEPQAFELALTISQFPDIVQTSCQAMDPSYLVQYMFKLAHATSQANNVLRVKGADPDIAQARLLLFWAAKTTLGNGLRLVGINPLNRM